ncbi:hypothetical protein DL96DRAFT_1580033 [Flagelloscypha sp. PMI_526]|nr:hypothetical protein DL96DRAFT_1580033 [Flagelloscypha sp. PMI_526]
MPPTTIHDIPPEILQHIFLFYVQGWHETLWSSRLTAQTNSSFQHWSSVLRTVCSSWDTQTVTCSALWAYLDLPRSGPAIEAHLSRSADLPLKLISVDWVSLSLEVNGLGAYTIVKYLDRVVSMDLRIPAKALAPILSFPMARLQRLVLEPRFQTHYARSISEKIVQFVESYPPSLTHFEIRLWPLELRFTQLPTSLQILKLKAGGDPSNLVFCNITSLDGLVNLVELELSGYYIPKSDVKGRIVDHTPLPPLDFPRLEVLRLSEATVIDVQRVLAALNIPPLLTLDITCQMTLLSDSIRELCDTLAWMTQSAEGATDTLVVCFKPSLLTSTWARHWKDAEGGIEVDPPSTLTLHLQIPDWEYQTVEEPDDPSFQTNEYKAISVTVLICRSFISNSLSSFDFYFVHPVIWSKEDWEDVLIGANSKSSGLEEARVGGLRRPRGIELFKVLAEVEEEEEEEHGRDEKENSFRFMHNLRRLYLSDVELGTGLDYARVVMAKRAKLEVFGLDL